MSKSDLGRIFDLAKRYYIDDAVGILDAQEFNTRCFLKAANVILNLKLNLKFPERKDMDPE